MRVDWFGHVLGEARGQRLFAVGGARVGRDRNRRNRSGRRERRGRGAAAAARSRLLRAGRYPPRARQLLDGRELERRGRSGGGKHTSSRRFQDVHQQVAAVVVILDHQHREIAQHVG